MDGEAIERELIEQLKEKGAIRAHYMDLVNDYMSLWDIKNQLIMDIKMRGVYVEWQNSETQYGSKKNDSVGELLKVNGQMLKILAELGIRGADIKAAEEEFSL